MELLHAGYFTYEENASNYVEALRSVILNIPQKRHRPTQNKKHGAWYCEYKPNKHTTWFITFDIDGEKYLIRNIFNNHTEDYPAFIRGIK